ncbi:hypothetical protein SAMN05192561_101824 [Halopenitus malekzadehii]|uniref:Winged helix-turn-helix DNA-binding n=1 Tax=Halopenitus malekzadehii TaxID=1267564 RepID=A0A1H6I014_9EURY|nr:hypothetical protein [Halopenitus malekzadehii]SEH41763.1 hypothetical protein SAMN05192561_101824 [Halopenitus malekzadehii]
MAGNSVNSIGDLIEISYRTANVAVRRLEDDGVLQEVTGQSRNRVFRAREVFEMIQKPVDDLRYW